ncbi:hypothetical protein IMZ48_12435 [Candidatus Bathyarchaeota archaeon]|nr:hypothetical protein [Candidatus Bathyarchaeota archaeon]
MVVINELLELPEFVERPPSTLTSTAMRNDRVFPMEESDYTDNVVTGAQSDTGTVINCPSYPRAQYSGQGALGGTARSTRYGSALTANSTTMEAIITSVLWS